MVKRRRRSCGVRGGGVAIVCLALASTVGCSMRADVARPLDDVAGGNGDQLTTAGTQPGSNTGGRQNGSGGQSGSVGGATGGNAGKPTNEGGQVEGGSGGGSAEGGSAGETVTMIPTVSEIMDQYRAWQPQSPDAVAISAYIFGLCRLPTLPEQQFAESEHGHGRYLRDWANPEAVAGITRRGAPPFGEGSVIVKEKFVASSTGRDLVAIAMMIKREPGFEPTHGDWDYAYYEPDLGVIQSNEQSAYCSGCHAGAASTDYVFVDGLQPGH
jgi:hypothetical protein